MSAHGIPRCCGGHCCPLLVVDVCRNFDFEKCSRAGSGSASQQQTQHLPEAPEDRNHGGLAVCRRGALNKGPDRHPLPKWCRILRLSAVLHPCVQGSGPRQGLQGDSCDVPVSSRTTSTAAIKKTVPMAVRMDMFDCAIFRFSGSQRTIRVISKGCYTLQ